MDAEDNQPILGTETRQNYSWFKRLRGMRASGLGILKRTEEIHLKSRTYIKKKNQTLSRLNH